MMKIDLELAKKYSKPGPRYTSYPTAPQFTEHLGAEDWMEAIQRNNEKGTAPLSLYYHIPFCDTLCYFCACTMMITHSQQKVESYLKALNREMALISRWIHPERKTAQIHFGGGTPTYLSPTQIRQLGEMIHANFALAEDCEFACEMDPRGLTRGHITALKDIGVNRASIGVQDFDPKVQEAVNRINPEEMIREVIGWVRGEGYLSLNLDLIYGLPFQTLESFHKTLEVILSMAPDRLAVFNYAHVPWLKAHQKLIHEETLPTPDTKIKMLQMIIETLTEAGYVYIGMDHFAKKDDELAVAQREKTLQRNFQGYSTKAGTDIYAFGMSAISQLPDFYAQNTKDIRKYHQRLQEGRLPMEKGFRLSIGDRIRQTVIMRLMCDMGINFKEISKKIHCDFETYFTHELSQMKDFVRDGLVEFHEEGLSVTETGRLFIRNIAMIFDAYLTDGEERFSKTV